ncbi:MAG: Fur family transcriptional regulator [Thermovirgaceae bacterium]
MWTVDEAIGQLKKSGAKITAQRVGIIKLLEDRRDHPSAERIYLEMKKVFPTISFATIYSTAQLLEKAGLIQIIAIDNKRVFFDPDPEVHGHFRCNRCKRLFDFPVHEDMVRQLTAGTPHNVSGVQLYLYGLCTECARREKPKTQPA